MKPFGKSFILCYMELMQIYVKMPVLWRHGRISTTPYIITPQLRRGHNSGYQNKWIFQLQDCDPCKLFTNKLYVHLGLQRQKWILPNLANQQTLQFTSFLFFFFNFIVFFNFTILYWFCHISKWIRHRYTCVPHPEPSSLPIFYDQI